MTEKLSRLNKLCSETPRYKDRNVAFDIANHITYVSLAIQGIYRCENESVPFREILIINFVTSKGKGD